MLFSISLVKGISVSGLPPRSKALKDLSVSDEDVVSSLEASMLQCVKDSFPHMGMGLEKEIPVYIAASVVGSGGVSDIWSRHQRKYTTTEKGKVKDRDSGHIVEVEVKKQHTEEYDALTATLLCYRSRSKGWAPKDVGFSRCQVIFESVNSNRDAPLKVSSYHDWEALPESILTEKDCKACGFDPAHY